MFLYLVTSLLVIVLTISSYGLDGESQNKLTSLLQRSAKTPKIKFIEHDFEYFITKGPRPYWILTILTATKSSSCQICHEMNPEFNKVAISIEMQSNRTQYINEEPLNVFVVEVDFLDNNELFEKLGVSTAPIIVLIPPTKARREIPLNTFFDVIGSKYQYSFTQGRRAENIKNWITHVSKISFTNSSIWQKIDYIIILVLLVGGAAAFYQVRKWMFIYAIMSLLVYGFVMTGGMFTIIQRVPIKGPGIGLRSFISPDGYQYAFEGFVLGILNVAAGLGAFLCINSLRKPEEHTNIWFRYIAHLPPWFGLCIMAGGCYAIIWIYSIKNTEYNMGYLGMYG